MTTTNRSGAFLWWCATAMAAVLAQEPSAAQRLAQATVLEARGELAAAEQELRAALATAQGADRAALERGLEQLRLRSGGAGQPAAGAQEPRGAQPATTAAAGDPVVQRLISDLELGTEAVEAVKVAREQLQSLGALAVPPLCARLPQLGPFGITNAIGLLRSDDPAVVAVLVALVERDAATAQLVVDRMDRLPYGAARSLCERLVAPKFPVPVRTVALALLAQRGAESAQLEPVVQALLAEPAAHGELVDVVRKLQATWVGPVLVTLSASPERWARGNALVARVEREPGFAERDFLQALAAIPVSTTERARWADAVVSLRPQWVEVACMGMAVADRGQRSDYLAVEWWRQPDAAATVLLSSLDQRRSSHERLLDIDQIAQILRRLIDAGWRIAPAHEDLLLRRAGAETAMFNSVIAGALPDEPRAIAFYERMGPQWFGAIGEVVHRRRPWHRLVVRALAALPDPYMASRLFEHDWNGVPDEVAAELTAVVARWVVAEPSVVNRRRVQPQVTQAATTRTSWTESLIEAVRQRGLPVSVLRPLVTAGSADALQALAERDPIAALELAVDNERPFDARLLADLARQHGSARQVPRLLREWRTTQVQRGPAMDKIASDLTAALRLCGPGHVDLIQLGTTGSPEHGIALNAAEGARVEDLDRLLAVLPGLDWGIIGTAHQALAPQLGKEHAAKLLSAVDAVLPAVAAAPGNVPRGHGAPGAIVHADGLLQHLDRLAVVEVSPRAARIVRDAIGDAELIELAARLALAHAGEQRAEVLRSFLAHPRATVVGIALQQISGAEWATFAEVATAAILRSGPQRTDAEALFESLDRGARTALALAVVGAPARRTFAPGLLGAALGALTAAKDARHLAQIQSLADDPRPEVREKVAQALTMTFDRAAAQALLELLKDEEGRVTHAARIGLQRLAEYLQTRAEWESKLK